jgi:hypothetical protein
VSWSLRVKGYTEVIEEMYDKKKGQKHKIAQFAKQENS